MRVRVLQEHAALAAGFLIVGFCCFDEEPLLDFTDLSLLHVGMLILGISVVAIEPGLRARGGQLVYKDTVSLLAALVFWLHLENYIRGLLLVLSVHSLLPLEADLSDLADTFLTLGVWVGAEALPCTFLLLVLFLSSNVLGGCLGVKQASAALGCCMFLCVVQALLGVIVAWDLFGAGLSALVNWERREVFYAQPRTG